MLQLSILKLIVSVIDIGILSSPQSAYARDDNKRVADGEFHQSIVKINGKRYKIDGNFDVEINDVDELAITKNSEASNTKNLKLFKNGYITGCVETIKAKIVSYSLCL